MRAKHILIAALIALIGCQSVVSRYERMSLGELVTLILELPGAYEMHDIATRKFVQHVFPIGTAKKEIITKLHEIRERHLYAAEFHGSTIEQEFGLNVFHFRHRTPPESGVFKEALMIWFTFDAADRLEKISYWTTFS